MRLKKDERIQKIIEAATALFARDNFKGVSTKEIAKLANCAESLIFKYFKTKEDIINAITENVFQKNDIEFNSLFIKKYTFSEWIENLFAFYIDQFTKDRDLYKFIYRQEYSDSQFANLVYQERLKKRLKHIVEECQKRQEAGEINIKIGCDTLAFIILELCNSISTKLLFLHLDEKQVRKKYKEIANTLALNFKK